MDDDLRAALRRLEDREVPFFFVRKDESWVRPKPRLVREWGTRG